MKPEIGWQKKGSFARWYMLCEAQLGRVSRYCPIRSTSRHQRLQARGLRGRFGKARKERQHRGRARDIRRAPPVHIIIWSCVCVYIHIYIYIIHNIQIVYISLSLYIYIYIYIYRSISEYIALSSLATHVCFVADLVLEVLGRPGEAALRREALRLCCLLDVLWLWLQASHTFGYLTARARKLGL